MICTCEEIIENIEIAEGIYRLSVRGKYGAKPGQFFMLKALGEEPLLPRPISIYDVNEDSVTFLYRVAGRGTKLLSKLKEEELIQIMGPLGTGYSIDSTKKNIAVIGGGIGLAPLNYLIKTLDKSREFETKIDFYVGFREEIFGVDNIKEMLHKVKIAVENGTGENKGYITDYFEPNNYDIVYCCGPEPMMKKVVEKCKKENVPIQISMEKRMACGIGACLGCTCNTKDGFRRTCSDGPVFDGYEVNL